MRPARRFRLLFLSGLIGLSLTTMAQDKPGAVRPYTIGDAVNTFVLKNVDETTVSLANYADRPGLVVVFLSNHCPFSKAYEDRLLALDRQFAPKGFGVLAIMSEDPAAYEADSFVNMKARAREKNFSFPYLLDDTQAVARQFGATRTPQAFVLHRVGGKLQLAYSGAIDDSPQDPAAVQQRYIELAINELLAGRPVTRPVTKPVGCALTINNKQ
jgi:peroxiredoxin